MKCALKFPVSKFRQQSKITPRFFIENKSLRFIRVEFEEI